MTSAAFELSAALEADEVGDVRRLVYKLQRRWTSNTELSARTAVAIHELLENAIKFSADGKTWVRLETEADQIRITTRNRASRDDADTLVALVRDLSAATDAMTFYVGLMANAPNTRGGLGIGRVAAECEMSVRCTVVDDLVEIEARTWGAA